MLKKNIIVSEMFYSLQGEGPSVGRPAVFLRLAACNLSCPGFSYKDPVDNTHLGCDTKAVWKKGQPYAFETIFDMWKKNQWLNYLANGAHCVITGGEPLLQQKVLTFWVQALDEFSPHTPIFIEVETNGTIAPNEYLSKRVDQFNVSPKLTNSGEERANAFQEEALAHFVKLPQSVFKFVIQSADNVYEVIEEYQNAFAIGHERIWLMPEGGTQSEMAPKMTLVAELCKTYQFNFSPRLHIHIWNEATGV